MTEDLEQYFAKGELIPAVVQEASTGQVLMLAYMNKESLKRTLESGYTWFWSRSRQELWNKGATSGHLQKVVAMYSDCDNDTPVGAGGADRRRVPHRAPQLFLYQDGGQFQ